MSTTTATTKRINTADYFLDIDDNVKKTFELGKYSKGGFQATIGGEDVLVSWNGAILNALFEGLPVGETITEGERKGKKPVSIPDAESFLKVINRLRAHREAKLAERHGKDERKPDPRNSLKNRLRGAWTSLRIMQEKAEKGGWGVDFSGFIKNLKDIEVRVMSLLIAETADNAAIEAIHKEMDEQEEAFKKFQNAEVLQDRLAAAKHALEQLEGSISAPDYNSLKARLESATEMAQAGNAEGARKVLYGDKEEGKDGLFAAFARVRGVVNAETRELGRGRKPGSTAKLGEIAERNRNQNGKRGDRR